MIELRNIDQIQGANMVMAKIYSKMQTMSADDITKVNMNMMFAGIVEGIARQSDVILQHMERTLIKDGKE